MAEGCAAGRTVDMSEVEYRNAGVNQFFRSRAWRRVVAVFSVLFVGFSLSVKGDSLDKWTKRTSGVGLNLYGVAHGNGKYVSVGQNGVVLVSSNGVSWESAVSGATSNLWSVAFGAGQYVAVGDGGLILRSSNATAWTSSASGTTNRLNHIAHCGGLWIATGNAGTLLTSPDGNVWTKRPSATSRDLFGAAFGNNTFLAIGRGSSNPGTVITSSNGVNWVDRTYPQLGVGFYCVAFGHGVFVVMDARGVPYTTTNGTNWTYSYSTSGDYVNGIVYAQNYFVGAGGPYIGGSQKIVTSPDGYNWKLRPISITNSAPFRAITYGNGYFVAVGEKGLIVQSDPIFSLRLSGFSNQSPILTLEGEIGRPYHIQSLVNSNWTDLVNTTNTSEISSHLDTQANHAAVRLYRAVTP